MAFLTLLGVCNYGLVLIFGLFLSTFIAGGWNSPWQKKLIFILCPVFLMLQSPCWLILGVETTKRLYPLIVHLPLVLILIFVLKKRFGIALVSVCTAYLCCQLPRWVNLSIAALTDSPLVGEISYTISIIPIFFVLRRYFVPAAHDAMTDSPSSLFLFGSLPLAYYVFDYTTVVYSDILQNNIQALNEFLPTALIFFYVMFLSAYHMQAKKRKLAELQNSMLEAGFKQSRMELENLQLIQKQTAIYQHDMRHHLNMIDGFLSADKPKQAVEYIRQVRSDVEAITPKRYCENELVNLLCSSFSDKAQHLQIQLHINVSLPEVLHLSDTELCTVISNAFENALQATSALKEAQRKWISFYCEIKHNKLLMEMKNPYDGTIPMEEGLPNAKAIGHGYGCRSMQDIVQRHQGLCSFEAEDGIFSFQAILPLGSNTEG